LSLWRPGAVTIVEMRSHPSARAIPANSRVAAGLEQLVVGDVPAARDLGAEADLLLRLAHRHEAGIAAVGDQHAHGVGAHVDDGYTHHA
jgi:hypothetical protein